MRRVPRYNQLPTCRHGHLLVEGNLIKGGSHKRPWTCRTCNRIACQRYTAKVQSQKVLTLMEDHT